MKYLIDANVLIDANRDYYPIERVPEFWDWMQHHGAKGSVKIPLEVYEEVKGGADDLATWVRQKEVKSALLLEQQVEPNLVAKAVAEGYAPDLTDDEIVKLGRDPFLLAYALKDPAGHTIVTTEVSRPSRQRANRHVPDVARGFGIQPLNTFQFVRALDFRTSWRSL